MGQVGMPSARNIVEAFERHGIKLGFCCVEEVPLHRSWSNRLESDPFADIRNGVLWMVEQSGRFPEVIVFGSRAMMLLMQNPDFIQRSRSCSKKSLEEFCGHPIEGIGPALNWPPEREFGVKLSSAVIFLVCPPIKPRQYYVNNPYASQSTSSRFKEEITHSYILFVGATI